LREVVIRLLIGDDLDLEWYLRDLRQRSEEVNIIQDRKLVD
jgi:hypothetical protein